MRDTDRWAWREAFPFDVGSRLYYLPFLVEYYSLWFQFESFIVVAIITRCGDKIMKSHDQPIMYCFLFIENIRFFKNIFFIDLRNNFQRKHRINWRTQKYIIDWGWSYVSILIFTFVSTFFLYRIYRCGRIFFIRFCINFRINCTDDKRVKISQEFYGSRNYAEEMKREDFFKGVIGEEPWRAI